MPFVGWLDSRVRKDDVGVGACEGVVCTEAGVDASYMENISTCLIYGRRPARNIPSKSCLSFG